MAKVQAKKVEAATKEDLKVAPEKKVEAVQLEEKQNLPFFEKFTRKGISEMRPYVLGEDLIGVSVSKEDNPEKDMGMIARNPKNHEDQWYVAKAYFDENLQPEVQPNLPELETTKTPETVHDKLVIQKQGLEDEIKGLKNFMDKNPTYKKLDQVQRSLMFQQLNYMNQYLTCLTRREEILRPLEE